LLLESFEIGSLQSWSLVPPRSHELIVESFPPDANPG